ncbi:MAG: hypothetical protein ACTSPQ_04130 [Candidatus Helarchaeota archaeon]
MISLRWCWKILRWGLYQAMMISDSRFPKNTSLWGRKAMGIKSIAMDIF